MIKAVGRGRLTGKTKPHGGNLGANGRAAAFVGTILPGGNLRPAGTLFPKVSLITSYTLRVLEGPVNDTVRCLMGNITYGRFTPQSRPYLL